MSYFNIKKKENREFIFYRFGGRCSYCGQPIKFSSFQIDHQDPIRRTTIGVDRDYSKENCYPSCRQCNASKSSFTLEGWRNELQLKVERLNKYYSIYRICKSFGLVNENPNGLVEFYFEKFTRNGA